MRRLTPDNLRLKITPRPSVLPPLVFSVHEVPLSDVLKVLFGLRK